MNSISKKMKVLQIMHGLAPGGIESFVINIYENINKTDIDINFAIAAGGKQYHEDRILNQGAKVYRTSDLNGISNIFKHFIRLIKLLKKEGPFDVVHTHIDFFNGVNLLAAFIAGVPVRISHAHNTNSANTQNTKPSLFIKIYRFVMRTLINTFSTHRLGCSQEANIYMYGNDYKYNRNTKVICNGIDVKKFSLERNNVLKLSNKNINFITIGRMNEQKNSLFIVTVINELRNLREDIHLYWVGQGPYIDKITNLIKQYNLQDYISLLGNRRDIPELLSEMDFMLLPSKWEGLPVVLVEAQTANIPCFISDTISKEANLGLCTILSLHEDEKVWASKINRYITTNSYNNKIDKERLRMFDIKNTVGELENIYLGVENFKYEEVI